MKRAVCLISGGLDSCVSLAEAVQAGFDPCLLHVRYGQRTEHQERAAFEAIADHYRVEQRLVCTLNSLARVGGSALTDTDIPLPEGDPDREDVPNSYVPFRNAHLLATAASWCEIISASTVYIGAVEEDSSGYPDCREEFFATFAKAVDLGTRPETRIAIRTPLIHLSKAEIVKRGLELDAPLHLTWSCYREGRLPCGRCDSCLLRARGFERAGVTDPAARS